MIHGIAYWLGLTSATDGPYLFWSGFAGDLGILAGVIAFYRHFECNVQGCHWPGRHHVHGTQFKTCLKHHPTKGNTAASIQIAHDGTLQERTDD